MKTFDNIVIREMRENETALLKDIMYESIYHPDKNNPYPKDVIYLPQVRVYWDNWGKGKNDICLVALIEDKVSGAVWVRTFPGKIKGFGYIDEETPEIAIALFSEYRNKGVGTLLMERMIEVIRSKGFSQVSLSISKGNPAITLYLRFGFKTIDSNAGDYLMLLTLDKYPQG